jgi:hypothetical protein
MLTVLILLVLAAALTVLILLAVIVVVMRQEPCGVEMDTAAPSPVAAMVRRVLGVSVRRPDVPADDAGRREGRWPSTRPTSAWTETTTRPPDRRR